MGFFKKTDKQIETKYFERKKKIQDVPCNFIDDSEEDKRIFCSLAQAFGSHKECDFEDCIFIKLLNKGSN